MPVTPSEHEDEYFARLEIRKRLDEQARQAQALAEAEKKRLKELHYQHCPKCGTPLHEAAMEGVTVDICPACHGLWLDDGELAKLTEAKAGMLRSLRKLLGSAGGAGRSAPAPIPMRRLVSGAEVCWSGSAENGSFPDAILSIRKLVLTKVVAGIE